MSSLISSMCLLLSSAPSMIIVSVSSNTSKIDGPLPNTILLLILSYSDLGPSVLVVLDVDAGEEKD